MSISPDIGIVPLALAVLDAEVAAWHDTLRVESTTFGDTPSDRTGES